MKKVTKKKRITNKQVREICTPYGDYLERVEYGDEGLQLRFRPGLSKRRIDSASKSIFAAYAALTGNSGKPTDVPIW